MESFKWGDVFVTGLPTVDEQHYRLVSMVNTFGETVAQNSATEQEVLALFQALAAYAQEHFKTEEELMAEQGVDLRHFRTHVTQHADFISDLSSLADATDKADPDDSKMLLDFLIHWLAYHILGTDQNMARQIEQISAGLAPEAAYEQGEQRINSSTEPLVLALNGLFALVSKRNKALAELNQKLELRVQERTQELSSLNQELEKISVTDHLTNLPNRRYAMNQLQALLRESLDKDQPLSCMMIDADGFKEINDTYGHDAGDTVLQRLAQELRDSVRTDDIVCRLGGDEFLLICPNTRNQGALSLAEQIRKNVAALRVEAGEGYWNGSVSIGVACTSQEGAHSIETLLRAADEAVYEAKRCGKNCVQSPPASAQKYTDNVAGQTCS